MVPQLATPTAGRVGELQATRYRLVYGPAAYIDIWSTHAFPENTQLRTIVQQFVGGISPGTATLAKTIPGTPIYVEMNFRRFQKLPLLRVKSIAYNNEGEADALKVSSFSARLGTRQPLEVAPTLQPAAVTRRRGRGAAPRH